MTGILHVGYYRDSIRKGDENMKAHVKDKPEFSLR